jgi:hypothetical protein
VWYYVNMFRPLCPPSALALVCLLLSKAKTLIIPYLSLTHGRIWAYHLLEQLARMISNQQLDFRTMISLPVLDWRQLSSPGFTWQDWLQVCLEQSHTWSTPFWVYVSHPLCCHCCSFVFYICRYQWCLVWPAYISFPAVTAILVAFVIF